MLFLLFTAVWSEVISPNDSVEPINFFELINDFDVQCLANKLAHTNLADTNLADGFDIPSFIIEAGADCHRVNARRRTRMNASELIPEYTPEYIPEYTLVQLEELWKKTLINWPDIYIDLSGKNLLNIERIWLPKLSCPTNDDVKRTLKHSTGVCVFNLLYVSF